MILLEDETLQREVLREAHESRLVTHHGNTKMYQDLREFYWWPNMKRKVTEYMAKCEVCQHVNMEHQKPTWFLQSYVIEVVRLHEVPVSIVLDQDLRFTF